jgi:hypothetical protein
MFGWSRRERADRERDALQLRIFELSHVQAGAYRQEVRSAVLMEYMAFYAHCLSRYALRGPDLEFWRYLCLESVHALVAGVVLNTRGTLEEPMENLEDELYSIMRDRENEYAKYPAPFDERESDQDKGIYAAARNIAKAGELAVDDVVRDRIVNELTTGLQYIDMRELALKIGDLLRVPDMRPPRELLAPGEAAP